METCKFNALDKRLKFGDVFDETLQKNLIIFCSYCVLIVFTSHDVKNRLFCKTIVLQSLPITSIDSTLFRPPPTDFKGISWQKQSLRHFVLLGSCIWKIQF